mmetsp:Transcript_5017/g.11065  ORF Transcript_5017/g.11065 Transcript_5017/m.11065 type:complete len:213 (-) Transcript_5017:52-690(-)
MAGTIEFTGLTIMATIASGQNLPQASTKPLAISALVLNKSSRVMPGLRGMPAGMSTRLHPVRHSSRWSIGDLPTSITKPLTVTPFSKWLKSSATPAGGTAATLKSKMLSSLTLGSIAISSERGWPMPPAPPHTHTLKGPAVFFAAALAFALAFAFALGFALALDSAFAASPFFFLGLVSGSGFALPFDFFFDFTTLQSSQYDSRAFFLYVPL